MKKPVDVHLGQEAFVLSREGRVIRTVVGILTNHGYCFLNGYCDREPHWFSLEDALKAADDRIKAQQDFHRKVLRTLARQRKTLTTHEYRQGVMTSPQKVVDLRNIERRVRTRYLKKVCPPQRYLKPGECVYAVITPHTRLPEYALVYRPYSHFVLEAKVESVCSMPDGTVCYSYTTSFEPGNFHLTKVDAMAELRTLLGFGPHDAHFVSSEKDEVEREKLNKVPF